MKRSMECKDIDELLPLYIDGELAADEASAVSDHLAGCSGCLKSLETYQALENSLSAMPDILPDPHAVASRISRRLGFEKQRNLAGIFRRMSLVWTFAVATAALILLVSRVDYVSALMSGQESLIDSAGRMMADWTVLTSGLITDVSRQFEAILSGDPWILAMGMIGFGLLVFTAGMAAALRTLR